MFSEHWKSRSEYEVAEPSELKYPAAAFTRIQFEGKIHSSCYEAGACPEKASESIVNRGKTQMRDFAACNLHLAFGKQGGPEWLATLRKCFIKRSKDKLIEPAYQELEGKDIPKVAIGAHHTVQLSSGNELRIWNKSNSPCRFVLIGGQPLNEFDVSHCNCPKICLWLKTYVSKHSLLLPLKTMRFQIKGIYICNKRGSLMHTRHLQRHLKFVQALQRRATILGQAGVYLIGLLKFRVHFLSIDMSRDAP